MLPKNVLGITRRERRFFYGSVVAFLIITMGIVVAAPGDVSLGGSNNVFSGDVTSSGTIMGANVTVSSGVFPGAASYTIYQDGANYVAKAANGTICWSSTNATTVELAAMNAGSSVWLSDGTYIITAAFQVYSGKILAGSRGAIVKVADNVDVNAVYMLNQQNATVQGFTIDGNRANHAQSAGNVDNVNGLKLHNATNCIIQNLYVYNTLYHGLLTEGTSCNNRISVNYFVDCGSTGAFYTSSCGICIFDNSTGNLISGNYVINAYSVGIRDEVALNGIGNTITNNIINATTDTYGVGIQIQQINNSLISKNKIFNCFDGMLIDSIVSAPNVGPQITDNQFSTGYYGINIVSYSQNTHISDNTFVGFNTVFYLQAASVTNTWIHGNTLISCTTEISDAGTGTIQGSVINRARAGTVSLLDTWATSPTSLANANDGNPATSTTLGKVASGTSAYIVLTMTNNYTCNFAFDFDINCTAGTYTVYLWYTVPSFAILNNGAQSYNTFAIGGPSVLQNWQLNGFAFDNDQLVIFFIVATGGDVYFQMKEFGAYQQITT